MIEMLIEQDNTVPERARAWSHDLVPLGKFLLFLIPGGVVVITSILAADKTTLKQQGLDRVLT